MSLAVDSPWVLAGLALALLPLVRQGMRLTPSGSLSMLPIDPVSTAVSLLLRLAAMAAITGLVLGMDDSFAGRAPNGTEESKSAAARRLLAEFVARRKTDLIGVAEYSTAPLFVIPLTENRQAVQAAIAATATPALAYTHVSKGLSMALSFFQNQPVTGSRIVLLVSDGAAAVDPDSEQKLREWFKRQNVRLYWIFLRTANSPGLFEKPSDPRDDNAQAMPELYLHKFFSSLGSPYKAYEAESPNALKEAIADIDYLENLPLHYLERIPKQDLSNKCYLWSAALIFILLAAKFCEIRSAP